MATSTANEIADYLLWFAKEHGDLLTALKLQKLMFYADAWHMVMHGGEQLIPEPFEAWVHGPVHRDTYHRFSQYRWLPIPCDADKPSIPQEVEVFLADVYRVFGGFSGFELEQLTHQETPWRSARGNLPSDATCTQPIDKGLTCRFYANMSQAEQ